MDSDSSASSRSALHHPVLHHPVLHHLALHHPASPRLARAAFAAVAVLTALVLAACSGGGASSSPPGSVGSAATSGGSATFAVDTPFVSFDPNVAAAAQDARVMRQIYDSLVALNADRQPVGWLAKSWKISNDGKTYTFTLRDDVTFQDGSKFDAAAVCFNLNRIVDPKSASIYAVSLVGPYQSCQATNATTAVVKLKTAYAPFIYNLSSPFLGMVSPKSAKSMSLAAFALHPVGSGPFKFSSYTPNDRIVLVKNPDYNWAPSTAKHTGPAHLDKLTFQIIPDATVRIGSLRNGSVQAIGNVPENQAAVIKKDPTLTFYAQAQSGSPFQLNFNTSHPPLNDPAVRKAIREGMDVGSAVKALYFGVYQRAWGPLSPTTAGYDKSLENSFSYNPAAAKKALDDLGWKVGPNGIREKNGKQLTLTYVEGAPNREKRQDIAQFMKDDLKAIGVNVNVVLQQSAPLQTTLQKGDYDIAGLSLVSVDPNVLYSLYSPEFIPKPGRSGFDFTHVDDKQLSSEILKAQQESDPASRDQLYQQVQQQIVDQALSVGIYVPTYTVATSGITGLRFDAEGYPVLYDVSLTKS